MKALVRECVERPVATVVGAVLVALFGGFAFSRLPVQLTPTLEVPRVTVTTEWPGASPMEVERELVLRQEEQLESIDGLVRMESASREGSGSIELSFQLGTEIDAALLQVSNRLRQVRERPFDAEQPVLGTAGSANDNVAWFMLQPRDSEEAGRFEGDPRLLGDLVEEVIQPRLERVAGVARVQIFGARRSEMQVWVDPADLAARRVTLAQLVRALEQENHDWGAGDLDQGKRRIVVRSIGAFRHPDDIRQVSIAMRDGLPVRVGDVATVRLAHADLREAGFFLGEPTVGVSVQKKAGANVLEVMEGLRRAAAELDEGPLLSAGLRLRQSYDETEYIDRAISLVRQSVGLGSLLAMAVLYLFLRSRATTFVVAVVIPLSLLGAFVVFWLGGRSLNVISMAGLGFAVGMVVDNAIVVVENIYRHRQMGKSRRRSAVDGTREVWGAVLSSTLTTIAVFLPIAFLEGEAGQLFGDLSLAIASSVGLSLVLALTLVPTLAAKLLGRTEGRGETVGASGLVGRAGRIDDWIGRQVYALCGSVGRRLAVVVGSLVLAVGLSWWLAPPAEYLPTGNRNFLTGFLLPPPGYNVGEVTTFHQPWVEVLRPLAEASDAEARELPGGGVRSFYFVAGSSFAVLGVQARDPGRVRELLPPIREAAGELPGTLAFFDQRSVFENVSSQGRGIELDLSGPDLDSLLARAGAVHEAVGRAMPELPMRPVPGLDLANPELRLVPDRRRSAELGLGSRDIGLFAASLVDGARAGSYLQDGREIDLRVRAGRAGDLPTLGEQGPFGAQGHFADLPLATPAGDLVTLGSVARLERTLGPEEIRRVDRRRTVTLFGQPPPDMPLSTAMARLDREVLEPLRSDGTLGAGYGARLSGTADQLTRMASSMRWVFLFSTLVTYLLLAALFESFVLPLVILFTVPLAALGGFLGLGTLRLFVPQGLDILTMLGFVILVGIVVNNAILVVHQTLHHRREDEMSSRDAITAATRSRVRPIFMSVTTSVFGMLPLVLVPGAGAELYRGLGSVVIGGLLVSTLSTLFVVPSLLGLVLDGRHGLVAHWRRRTGYRAEDSSRYDLLRPDPSGLFAADGGLAREPSGYVGQAVSAGERAAGFGGRESGGRIEE